MTCVSLITALGILDPVSAAGKLTALLQWCHASQIQPPPELVHHLLTSLCTLVAVPGGESFMKQAIKFLDAEEGGLLAHKRFQRDEVLLVLQQLAVLAKAFLAAYGKRPASGTTGTYLPLANAFDQLKLTIACALCHWASTSWQIALTRTYQFSHGVLL